MFDGILIGLCFDALGFRLIADMLYNYMCISLFDFISSKELSSWMIWLADWSMLSEVDRFAIVGFVAWSGVESFATRYESLRQIWELPRAVLYDQ